MNDQDSPQICLITGNEGKRAEFERLLGFSVTSKKIDLTETQSLDIHAICEAKALEAFQAVGSPVLVDDTALVIDEWNGLPGPLVKWFLDSVGCEGILKMAGTLSSRNASVTTCLGYADENGARVFEGVLSGKISESESGENGFGYDPIFVPEGQDQTFAEMTNDQKDALSMRRLAVDEFKGFLAAR